jgi:hypothetical protein
MNAQMTNVKIFFDKFYHLNFGLCHLTLNITRWLTYFGSLFNSLKPKSHMVQGFIQY